MIDDGSHRYLDQDATLHTLWPRVREGGFYVIEDVVVGALPWDAAHAKQVPRTPTPTLTLTLTLNLTLTLAPTPTLTVCARQAGAHHQRRLRRGVLLPAAPRRAPLHARPLRLPQELPGGRQAAAQAIGAERGALQEQRLVVGHHGRPPGRRPRRGACRA